MKDTPRMLDHPLYLAWERGEVPREDLAVYHRSYAEFIQNFPLYWQRVVNTFRPEDSNGARIVQEERDHILLWEAWGKDFSYPDSVPRLRELLTAFESLNPSELLGAIQAFETQMPEVSRTKKRALVRQYGFSEDALEYMDVHMQEEPHIAYGSWLAYRSANKQEFDAGFRSGAELIYRSLDAFYPPRPVVQ